MNHTKGAACSITAFRVHNPSPHPLGARYEWMAIATAQVWDDDPPTATALSPTDKVQTGQVMQGIDARAVASSELEAMTHALKSLHFQLECLKNRASSAKHDPADED